MYKFCTERHKQVIDFFFQHSLGYLNMYATIKKLEDQYVNVDVSTIYSFSTKTTTCKSYFHICSPMPQVKSKTTKKDYYTYYTSIQNCLHFYHNYIYIFVSENEIKYVVIKPLLHRKTEPFKFIFKSYHMYSVLVFSLQNSFCEIRQRPTSHSLHFHHVVCWACLVFLQYG